MARTVNRRPEVTRDLIELADHLSQSSWETSERFLAAVEETFIYLAENPNIGMRCLLSNPRANDLRWWRVKGFDKHLIFFRPIDHGVDVVRVLHSARNWEALLGK